MEYQEAVKIFETLRNSPDFLELQALLGFADPNIWQILGISYKEIRITRFLTWLLNPQSQHSFRARFLKNFLVEALKVDRKTRAALLID